MVSKAASAFYTAGSPPSDPAMLPAYLSREFERIAWAIGLLAKGHVDMTYVAPEKPRDGDIRLADGVHWDPVGAGAARFVGYRGGAWVLLG